MLTRRVATAIKHPVHTMQVTRAKVARGHMIKRYADLARRAGIDRIYLVMSFDCDKPDDALVARKVHEKLMSRGVVPTFAVPGATLEQHPFHYQELLGKGAEFINHGYAPHTRFDATKKRYESCGFYNGSSSSDIRADISRADRTLRDVLGIRPSGFRTPHFGMFQKRSQVQFLHQLLTELGYGFSSSTSPIYGFRHGPMFWRSGVCEFPLTGMVSNPLYVLDTWICFAAPDRTMTPDDYVREGKAIADAYGRAGVGILNFYGDPSHIHDSDEFFETVDYWLEMATPTTYSELLNRAAPRKTQNLRQ